MLQSLLMENSSYHLPSLETVWIQLTAKSYVYSYSFNDISSDRPGVSFLRQFSGVGQLITCSLVPLKLPILPVRLRYDK